MNIDEAKSLYLYYYGSEFLMCREDEKKWAEFRELKISADVREKWRQELIDKLFSRSAVEVDNRWVYFDTLIDVLIKSTSKREENCYRLLDWMSRLDCLNEMEATVITETMAGRSANFSNGAVKFICENSKLIDDFEGIICRINKVASIEDVSDNTKLSINERKRNALISFKKAVEMYSRADERRKKWNKLNIWT